MSFGNIEGDFAFFLVNSQSWEAHDIHKHNLQSNTSGQEMKADQVQDRAWAWRPGNVGFYFRQMKDTYQFKVGLSRNWKL